jgi:tetratricopeptide (TPR) repeat protein
LAGPRAILALVRRARPADIFVGLPRVAAATFCLLFARSLAGCTMRRFLAIAVGAAIFLGAAGYWVLITPDNPFTGLFKSRISEVDAKVVIGPYPNDGDMRALAQNHVTTIVSLLDSSLPYEKVLLDQERELAARHGIKVLNFPMASVLGQKFGDYYQQSASNAAKAIAASEGKVYLHCYLGMHRAVAVREELAKLGTSTGSYALRKGERAEGTRQIDEAEKHFNAGRFKEALALLDSLPDLPLGARVLRAWSAYRLGDLTRAGALFADVLREDPNLRDGHVGLGYCLMRDGDLAGAEQHFAAVVRADDKDGEALAGLGMVCYRAGRREEAIRYLEAAQKLQPNDQDVKDILDRLKS